MGIAEIHSADGGGFNVSVLGQSVMVADEAVAMRIAELLNVAHDRGADAAAANDAGNRLLVFCSRPGLIRGGRHNPVVAEYEAGAFSEAQLLDLIHEPAITLGRGRLMPEDMRARFAENAPARDALITAIGLNLDGLDDALNRRAGVDPRAPAPVVGPVRDQGSSVAVAGALHAAAEDAAAATRATHETKGRRR